jgi:S-formylglutathione hydrolase
MPRRTFFVVFCILLVIGALSAGCNSAPAASQPAPQATTATLAAVVTQPPAPTATQSPAATATQPTAEPTAVSSPAPTSAPKRIQRPEIPAPSLAKNLVGEPAERQIYVYLPPSYFSSPDRHYPVVYYLPGYGDQTIGGVILPTGMDEMIAKGTVQEMILVVAHGMSALQGSFYTNSPVTGNWADYIAKDVVGYIDANYRTVASPAGRGITGHSMGGFGALNLAMRYPEVFSAVYSISPGLFDPQGLAESQMFADPRMIDLYEETAQELATKTPSEAVDAMRSQGGDLQFAMAYGAAFAADPNGKAPFSIYPYKLVDGQQVRDDTIWQTWEQGYGGISEKATQFKDNWLKLKGITVDCGSQDNYQWIPKGCTYFKEQMAAAGIPVELIMHDGTHDSKLKQSVSDRMLPYFSKLLQGGQK